MNRTTIAAFVAVVLASDLGAQDGALPDTDALAKAQRRSAEIAQLLSSSRPLSAPPTGPTVRYAFIFSGPTVDEDLARFYTFFARRYPDALRPVEIRSDLAAQNCKASAEVCATLSHAVFAYGLLARDFPPGFERGVLEPLKDRFKTPAVPGLSFEVLDIPQRRWLPSYGDKVARSRDKKVICREIRFDDADCIMDVSGNHIFLRGQALQVTLELPAEIQETLIRDYTALVAPRDSYKQDWHSFFQVRPATIESAQTAPEPLNGFDYDTADTDTLEGQSFDGICNNDGTSDHLMAPDSVIRHVTAYRREAFPDGIPSVAGLRQPYVIFFDRFAEGPRQKDLVVGSGTLDHPDFHATPINAPTLCLDRKPPQISGHGLFGLGLFAARRNGIGIVGLLPDYDLNRITAIDVMDNRDLLAVLTQALDRSFKDKNTVIANISLSVPNDDTGNSFDLFRKMIRGAQKNVLYIAAAGQPPGGPPQFWKDPCLQVFPCLGDEPNVIVVAAQDHSRQDTNATLWTGSNYGPKYVAVAAPGTEIISTDRRDAPEAQFGYSVRSGTSESAVFVTAAAATILAQNPGLKPELLKQRILARTAPLEVISRSAQNAPEAPPHYRYLFGADGRVGVGDPASVTAGSLLASTAMTEVPGEATAYLVGLDKPLRGKVRFANDLGEIVLYRSPSGGANFAVGCPVLGLARLSRREPNQYSMYCEKDLVDQDNVTVKTISLFYDSYYLVPEEGESPMSCLYRTSACISIERSDTKEVVPIDLRKLQDLYVNLTAR